MRRGFMFDHPCAAHTIYVCPRSASPPMGRRFAGSWLCSCSFFSSRPVCVLARLDRATHLVSVRLGDGSHSQAVG